MLLESCVAIMAMIAACTLDPAIFFAINSPKAVLGENPSQTIATFGFILQNGEMENLATKMGEQTLFSRVGGAPSLAVSMAKIFSSAFGEKMLSMWYHFAIMFEAIFILTTLDAGTRVARFMLEDLLNFRNKKFHQSVLATIFSSLIIVSAWGYFLYVGVIDPKGGINILWPLFGMSNQMLAGIALSLATIVIFKNKKGKLFLITFLPLCFILFTTSFAVIEKVFSPDLKIGFLAMASSIQLQLNQNLILGTEEISIAKKMIFNQKLLSFFALSFLVILWIVFIEMLKKIKNVHQKV
jgi:carbon starvation protein